MTHRSETRKGYNDALLARAEATALQRILVISSPSGGGKTTLRRLLMNELGTNREFLVSYTTRLPRPDEVDGVDYHFLVKPFLDEGMSPTEAQAEAQRKFDELVANGDILFEHTNFYGNRYGTPRAQLEQGLAANKQMIADVNLEGLNAFRTRYPGKVAGIFLMPPSIETLRQRLNVRLAEADITDDTERQRLATDIEERLAPAQDIINQSPLYDYVIEQENMLAPETYRRVCEALKNTPRSTQSSFSRDTLGKYSIHAPEGEEEAVMAKLNSAKNVYTESNGMGGHAPDYTAIEKLLKTIRDKPYLQRVLENVCAWNPRFTLSMSSIYADKLWAPELITNALKRALSPALSSGQLSGDELPVELIDALRNMEAAQPFYATSPAFAEQLVAYEWAFRTHYTQATDYEEDNPAREAYRSCVHIFAHAHEMMTPKQEINAGSTGAAMREHLATASRFR